METRGRHVIAELDGCEAKLLTSMSRLRRILIGAAQAAHATVLTDEFFEFPGGGVSGFVLLAESHISIHTWPEQKYAAIDIYTCGLHTMPDLACAYLVDRLGASATVTSTLDRGLADPSGRHLHCFSTESPRGRTPELRVLSTSA